MRLGISTASFFGREVTEQSLDIMNTMGITLCETFLTTYMEYEPSFASVINAHKKNVEIYSVHSLNTLFEPQLFNRADRTRKDAEFFFQKVVTIASSIGAKAYTFHGFSSAKAQHRFSDLEWINQRVTQLVTKANSYGVTLCYENVHWALYNYPEFIVDLEHSGCTGCSICLDVKQAYQSGHSVYEYIDNMTGRIANVHLCDIDSNGQTCLPGEGVINFDRLFRYLLDKGYDGNYMLEVYSKDYKKIVDLDRSYNYLQEIINKI